MVEESSLRQSETFPQIGQIDHDIDHLDHLDPNRTIQWLGGSSVAMVDESSLPSVTKKYLRLVHRSVRRSLSKNGEYQLSVSTNT